MVVDENSSSSADAEMYTSEKTQSLADVDSGIEGMEVDEADTKMENKRKRVSYMSIKSI